MGEALPLQFPIYTERLKIRFFEEDDQHPHYRIMSNPDTVRFLYESPLSIEESTKHLRPRITSRSLVKNGDWVNFAVELIPDTTKDDGSISGVFVGELGLGCADRSNRCFEVGYVFLPEYCGQGYAREAVKGLIKYAFENLGAHRIAGKLDARNERSARLLECIGMKKEGVLRETEFIKGEWTDEAVYGILEKDWFGESWDAMVKDAGNT